MSVDKREPSFFEARLRAADVLREQGKVDEAERALNDAAPLVSQADTPVQVEERRIELAVALSQVDEKRGDAARAARRLDEAIGKGGDARGDARLILARAAVDERRGDWQRAIARGEQLLARKPRSVEALNFVGFVAADHNHDLPRTLRRAAGRRRAVAGVGRDHRQPRLDVLPRPAIWRAPTFTSSRPRGSSRAIRRSSSTSATCTRSARNAIARWRPTAARSGSSPTTAWRASSGDRIRTLEAKSAAGR